MFGRDPVLPLNTLFEPKIRYMGNDINVLSLEAMKNMFEIAAANLKLVLCNPKFVSKNKRYFDLSSIYFLYPLTSLPKIVKREMPASSEQT